MKKVRIRVEGKVQGVGFRYFTLLEARKFPSLGGIIRNEYDGSVTIEANGPQSVVDEFIKIVKNSPAPQGRVSSIEVIEDASIQERSKFKVV